MSVIHQQMSALAGSGVEVILADPPWDLHGNSKEKPGRNPRRHYSTMSLADIASIPVKAALAEKANLFLWVPGPFLVIGAHIPIMKAWGFNPTAMGFVWIKMKNSASQDMKVSEEDLARGLGQTTIKNAEFCILGKRKRSLRVKPVFEIILAPRQEHSRKPPEAARRILEYVGPGRRCIEMFSRETSPGFEPLGNQTGIFDEIRKSAE